MKLCFRLGLALTIILVSAHASHAFRRGARRACASRCRSVSCATSCCASSPYNCEPRSPYCVCLTDEIATFPSSAGDQTLYKGARYEEECQPTYCNGPTTVYFMDDPGLEPEVCNEQGTGNCSVRAVSRCCACLEDPVKWNYLPRRVGSSDPIDGIVHTDFLKFDADSGPTEDWVRAKVFIVKLPDDVNRPGRPGPLVAFGFEVEEINGGPTSTSPNFSVFDKDVKQYENDRPICLHYVNVEGVTTYGIFITQR